MIAAWLSSLGADWLIAALPVIGVLIFVRANEDNIRGTWAGRWGSNPVTWTLWTLLGWTSVGAQAQMGGGIALWLLTAIAVTCTAVAAGALRLRWQAHRGRKVPAIEAPPWQRWVDVTCGIVGAAALVALLSASGQTAMWLTIAADATAALPTFAAAWHHPHSQPLTPFVGSLISASATLAVLESWSFDAAGYTIYLWWLSIALIAVITTRRYLLPARPAPVPHPEPMRWPPPGLRPAPELAAESTTESIVPPWARNPHSAALRELIPPELYWEIQVPAVTVIHLVEHAYTEGHLDGAGFRDRLGIPAERVCTRVNATMFR